LEKTVSVIDPTTNTVTNTIMVADSPRKIVEDADGKIWVLCAGFIEYNPDFTIASETPSALVRINAITKEVEATITLFDTQHPNQLGISPDGSTLYIGGGFGFQGIYTHDVSSSSFAGSTLIDSESFYGFSVNPENGNVYGFQAPTFTDPGLFIRYNASGSKLGEYTVGIGPNGAAL
jgi:hypothetical protein